MASVIDIVTFNNEFHLLDLRVKILENVVDRFYVIEATQTHQGAPKECRGHEYVHPKVQIVTIDFPENLDNWGRENYQRAYAIRLEEFETNDMVLTGDLDEIPDPEAIAWLKDNWDPTQIYLFNQLMFQYYLNNRNFSEEWHGTRATNLANYYKFNGQGLRFIDGLKLPNAGWHFSFLGGQEVLRKKITEYAHSEFNNDEVLDSIEERLKNNQDIFNRGMILETVEIDESFPQYIRDNQDKLQEFIKNT